MTSSDKSFQINMLTIRNTKTKIRFIIYRRLYTNNIIPYKNYVKINLLK